ncbi:MAG: HD domain-containing protein [Candidatus Micrarchaeota archaeon]|nr:HD domain-containing protein [Candidatus Micrarchaeota archaeon]
MSKKTPLPRAHPLSSGITIRDPVHGPIEFTPVEQRLLDSPDFQRLRGIKQLAMAHLVYPGAHHTRFEHSIGTLHLADAMASRLRLSEDERARLRLSALLHDVGHIAFSHEAEEVTAPRLGDHEKMGAQRIRSSPLCDIISESDDPKTVAAWATGASYGQLITSDVGADRIDYLLRDAHYTGVAYGVVDWARIIGTLSWDRAGPALEAGGLEAAESLVLARFAMFHTVYFHHAVRIARAMLQQGLRAALADSKFDWKAAVGDGDTLMLQRLRAVAAAQPWAEALIERRLYKRAAVIPWKDVRPAAQQAVRSGKLAQELSAAANGPVILDPPGRFVSGTTLRILTAEGPQPLGSLSPLVASLQSAADARANLLVCCPPQRLAAVSRAAAQALES